MTPPLVSVLIPTYKYARYLAETIESVLEQDYPNFEVLVSDDCSGDGSAEIILRYAARDPRIRAQIHGSNLGMVENWNWCLREARGEYVKFLFGDDKLASPQALSKLARLLESSIASRVRLAGERSDVCCHPPLPLRQEGQHRN